MAGQAMQHAVVILEAGIMISRRVALRHWGKVKKTTV